MVESHRAGGETFTENGKNCTNDFPGFMFWLLLVDNTRHTLKNWVRWHLEMKTSLIGLSGFLKVYKLRNEILNISWILIIHSKNIMWVDRMNGSSRY